MSAESPTEPSSPSPAPRWRFTIRDGLLLILVVALACSNLLSWARLREANVELDRLRREVGDLGQHSDDRLVAVRLRSAEPLQWQLRVRVPEQGRYRVAYSAWWPADTAAPQWFAAVALEPGESVITARIGPDPRDGRWKLSVVASHALGDRRMASTLAEPLADVFRGSHQVIRAGVDTQPIAVGPEESIRLLEDRYLVGDGAQRLYGAAPPEDDQPGVFLELQPDIAPL
ncbi:hypothetical protein [Roseimaritima sediminicola]|uniref:hypothetical protein n=1 Tax=Roseimaritima sediminicola TaxID=2662066 RepID=UPI0012985836|nr:hypothetical protein [Roseimaritima sediminicola]